MKKTLLVSAFVCLFTSGVSFADIFAAGTANEFTIDFVSISSATNPASGYGIVNHDYRMGTYEITNDQWTKFKSAYGDVKGTPTAAYDADPFWTGTNVPTNNVSWYEAAQFVNWLNIDAGHQAAYNFTGTQGTDDYTLGVWDTEDAWGGTNLFRHKDAFYFLPTEDEWVKAAYWNETNLQTYATKAGESLHQGDGISGTGWNYYDSDYATDPSGPWAVGSGSAELNGTFDMMGNVGEWMESLSYKGEYISSSFRGVRGGAYVSIDYTLRSSWQVMGDPRDEVNSLGFRVASVPEPCSLVLLGLGGLVLRYRKR